MLVYKYMAKTVQIASLAGIVYSIQWLSHSYCRMKITYCLMWLTSHTKQWETPENQGKRTQNQLLRVVKLKRKDHILVWTWLSAPLICGLQTGCLTSCQFSRLLMGIGVHINGCMEYSWLSMWYICPCWVHLPYPLLTMFQIVPNPNHHQLKTMIQMHFPMSYSYCGQLFCYCLKCIMHVLTLLDPLERRKYVPTSKEDKVKMFAPEHSNIYSDLLFDILLISLPFYFPFWS